MVIGRVITKTLFTLTLALAVISTYLAFDYKRKYETAIAALANHIISGNAAVVAASDPKTGDVYVQVNGAHIHYFASLCRRGKYF